MSAVKLTSVGWQIDTLKREKLVMYDRIIKWRRVACRGTPVAQRFTAGHKPRLPSGAATGRLQLGVTSKIVQQLFGKAWKLKRMPVFKDIRNSVIMTAVHAFCMSAWPARGEHMWCLESWFPVPCHFLHVLQFPADYYVISMSGSVIQLTLQNTALWDVQKQKVFQLLGASPSGHTDPH